MKQNTLYTINRWNKGGINKTKVNKFLGGGGLIAGLDRKASSAYGANYGDAGFTLDDYINSRPAMGIANMVANASPALTGLISGGYSTNGVGEKISGIGNAVGDAVGAIPVIGTIGKPIVKLASSIGGGLYNLFKGVKENKANIAAIDANTTAARNTGAQLGNATTNEDVLAASGNMVSGLGFSANDLYKNGLATRRGTRMGNAKINTNNSALAFQTQGLATGVDNADYYSDSNTMRNFGALGGPLDMGVLEYDLLKERNAINRLKAENKNTMTNMFAGGGKKDSPKVGGATLGGGKYNNEALEDLMFYLSQKEKYPNGRKKTDAEKFLNYRLGIPERKTAPWFERMPAYIPESPFEGFDKVIGTISKIVKSTGKQTKEKTSQGEPYIPHFKFAFGGDMQTNSSDFSTGATHVNAGGTHEENKYGGVQLGLDGNRVPNLVEEGEVIYNDYVYSDRIQLDDEAKEKFHFSKKKDLTYAEAAKKLEKEISERPNDPLSQAAYKAQMEDLANEQERQKQEMEADRAREAFESLSDEDKVALMQQVAQEEQMAQQQAMEEQAMAEQQMMNPQVAQEVPQEAMIPQEQVVPQEVPVEAQTMAEGGNLYLDGGILDYVKLKYKGKDPERIAEIIEKDLIARKVAKRKYKAKTKDGKVEDRTFWNRADIVNAYSDLFTPNNKDRNHIYERLRNAKLSEEEAFSYAFPEPQRNQYASDAEYNTAVQNRNNAYKMYLNSTSNAPTTLKEVVVTPNNTTSQPAKVNASKSSPQRVASTTSKVQPFNVQNVEGLEFPQTTVSPTVSPNTLTMSDAEKAHYNDVISSAVADAIKQEADNVYNKTTQASPTASTSPTGWKMTPNYKNDKLRYFGLLGPAAAITMQAFNVGRPKADGIMAAARMANRPVGLAEWMPRGDFAVYRPDDPWFYTSPIIAQSNATQRAINNRFSPSIGAETVMNGYNTMVALANAQRQQADHNFDKNMKVLTYNGTVNDANQREFGQTSRFNAEAGNRHDMYAAQMAMQAAAQKADMDAGWYNSLYGNIGSLTGAIADIGRENAQHNMIAEMGANGLFGVMSPNTQVGRRGKYWTWEPMTAAYGGKVKKKNNKKRGLTF